MNDLHAICRDIRCDTLRCIGHLGVGHIGGCLSLVELLGVQDRFGEVGTLPCLREAMGLTVENIVQTAKKAVGLN